MPQPLVVVVLLNLPVRRQRPHHLSVHHRGHHLRGECGPTVATSHSPRYASGAHGSGAIFEADGSDLKGGVSRCARRLPAASAFIRASVAGSEWASNASAAAIASRCWLEALSLLKLLDLDLDLRTCQEGVRRGSEGGQKGVRRGSTWGSEGGQHGRRRRNEPPLPPVRPPSRCFETVHRANERAIPIEALNIPIEALNIRIVALNIHTIALKVDCPPRHLSGVRK
eukprot:1188399-Prorocentrum_minimum.AAC.3